MSNPFKIGDTVELVNPALWRDVWHGPKVIRDIRDNQKTIRCDCLDWAHFSHFRLVSPGTLSKLAAATEVVPVLESDPNGLTAGTLGAKFDQGKPEAGLLQDFGLALLAVAEVGTYGARKYTRTGWLHVDDGERRYRDAGLRHRLMMGQEEHDPGSGLSHLSHAAWNALAELELHLRAQKTKSP